MAGIYADFQQLFVLVFDFCLFLKRGRIACNAERCNTVRCGSPLHWRDSRIKEKHTHTYLFKFSYFNFLISVISFILVHYFFFPLSFVYISVIEYLLLFCLHL